MTVGSVDMEMSGAMFVLGVCQVSLFNWKGCFWKVSVSEVDTGLFWRVLTWFVEDEGLVCWGVSETSKVVRSRFCRCILMAIRKLVWFSWICAWHVWVTRYGLNTGFLSLRSIGFLSVMDWAGVFCICFSNLVSCLLMVWRLVFVKLFCWMMCLVFVRVSSPGNLYRAASIGWSLWVSWMLRRGGWSDSTVDPLVRVYVGVLKQVVIGHACLMDVKGYVICCAGA